MDESGERGQHPVDNVFDLEQRRRIRRDTESEDDPQLLHREVGNQINEITSGAHGKGKIFAELHEDYAYQVAKYPDPNLGVVVRRHAKRPINMELYVHDGHLLYQSRPEHWRSLPSHPDDVADFLIGKELSDLSQFKEAEPVTLLNLSEALSEIENREHN